MRRGIPSMPTKCMGKKVMFAAMNISQNVTLPIASLYMRPVNLGNQ